MSTNQCLFVAPPGAVPLRKTIGTGSGQFGPAGLAVSWQMVRLTNPAGREKAAGEPIRGTARRMKVAQMGPAVVAPWPAIGRWGLSLPTQVEVTKVGE